MTSRPRLLAACMSITFLLAACNAGSTSEDPTDDDAQTGREEAGGTAAPGADDLVRIGLVAEPASLDFTTTDGAAIPQALLYNVNETLVKVDQSGEIVPALASEWEVSDDRLTYTFTLESGVAFSNGEELTADDVVTSFEAVQNDWTVSLKSQFDIIESIEATADDEVVITLSRPSNSFVYSLTTRVGAIFDANSMDD